MVGTVDDEFEVPGAVCEEYAGGCVGSSPFGRLEECAGDSRGGGGGGGEGTLVEVSGAAYGSRFRLATRSSLMFDGRWLQLNRLRIRISSEFV